MSPDLDEMRRHFMQREPEPEPKAESAPEPRKRRKTESPKEANVDIAALAKKRGKRYAIDGDDAIVFFGKHRDKRVSTLAATRDGRDYMRWMLTQTFDPELLKVVRVWLAKT